MPRQQCFCMFARSCEKIMVDKSPPKKKTSKKIKTLRIFQKMLAFTNTNTLFLSISPRSCPNTHAAAKDLSSRCLARTSSTGFLASQSQGPVRGQGFTGYTSEVEVIFLEKKDHDLFLVMLKKGEHDTVNPGMSIHEHLQDVLISIPPIHH